MREKKHKKQHNTPRHHISFVMSASEREALTKAVSGYLALVETLSSGPLVGQKLVQLHLYLLAERLHSASQVGSSEQEPMPFAFSCVEEITLAYDAIIAYLAATASHTEISERLAPPEERQAMSAVLAPLGARCEEIIREMRPHQPPLPVCGGRSRGPSPALVDTELFCTKCEAHLYVPRDDFSRILETVAHGGQSMLICQCGYNNVISLLPDSWQHVWECGQQACLN